MRKDPEAAHLQMARDVSMFFKALQFAAAKHRDQRRKNKEASPYINHLIDVARLLWSVGGIRDRATVVAGILHDTVEDTETSLEEIAREFSPRIGAIVAEVTDPKGLHFEERKRLQIDAARSKSEAASHIKLADKTSNIRDIVLSPPKTWSPERRLDYVDWAEKVVHCLPHKNEGLLRCFEEACAAARDAIG